MVICRHTVRQRGVRRAVVVWWLGAGVATVQRPQVAQSGSAEVCGVYRYAHALPLRLWNQQREHWPHMGGQLLVRFAPVSSGVHSDDCLVEVEGKHGSTARGQRCDNLFTPFFQVHTIRMVSVMDCKNGS